MERLLGSRVAWIACTHLFDGVKRFAALVLLLVNLSVAEHLGLHVGGEGVDTRHTHTVQTS